MFAYIYTCIYIYIYTCIHIYIYTCICTCAYIYIHTYMKYVRIYTYIYIYLHVCVYIHILLYIRMSKRRSSRGLLVHTKMSLRTLYLKPCVNHVVYYKTWTDRVQDAVEMQKGGLLKAAFLCYMCICYICMYSCVCVCGCVCGCVCFMCEHPRSLNQIPLPRNMSLRHLHQIQLLLGGKIPAHTHKFRLESLHETNRMKLMGHQLVHRNI